MTDSLGSIRGCPFFRAERTVIPLFKSVFKKYLFAFMLIITVSFIILTFVAAFFVDTYSINMKTDILEKVAYSYAKLASEEYQIGDFGSFGDYVAANEITFADMFEPLSINQSKMIVFFTDRGGTVVFSAGYEEGALEKAVSGALVVPETTLNTLENGKNHSWFGVLEGFFRQRSIVCEAPVLDGNGNAAGFVFAVSSDLSFSPILRATIRTVVISSLWVMLASFVAVYFISERMIAPLRAMSAAAKNFAAGHFDVRIPVTGNDEVAELAEAFNQMAGSLGALEEMRSSFIANVSHDLRTPMTTIAGFIDGILDGAIPPEKEKYYLGIIADEVRRLSRLVTSLLDLSKLEAGEREFHFAPFDVCEMARCVLISFEQKIDAKQLEVVFSADDDNMFVRGDSDSIHQVIYNLCDNAVKFAKEKGKLEISAHRLDGKISVSVYNEGDGIPEDKLPYVFDRFFKSDSSRGLDKTGVGLGLAICRTIIDAHGEKIRAESAEGRFCRFTFTLPPAKDPRSSINSTL